MGLSTHEGKNIEKLLVGVVKTPLSEARWDQMVFTEGTRKVLKQSLSDQDYYERVKEVGIGTIRGRVARTLPFEMDRVRKDQAETKPHNPKGYFGKNLLKDLDVALGGLEDIEDGRYELRFYSARDTLLDFGGSFDCWVEIYDLAENKVLADSKIDVTANPTKKVPKHLADIVLYCDSSYINDDVPGRIEARFFSGPEYKHLVEVSARLLASRAHLPLAH